MAAKGNKAAQELWAKREEIVNKHWDEFKSDADMSEAQISAEIIAEAYEKWLYSGQKAEDAATQKLFTAIRDFFRDIYRSIKAIGGVEVTEEVDAFFREISGLNNDMDGGVLTQRGIRKGVSIKEDLQVLGYNDDVFFAGKVFVPASSDMSKINKYKEIIDKKQKSIKVIDLGRTPQKLVESGLPQRNITIDYSVIAKAQNGKNVGHDLTSDMLKAIPEQLYNPIGVMYSRTESGSVVVITEIKDKGGYPVIVAVRLNTRGSSNTIIHSIRSVHGRNNFDELFGLSIAEGKLIKIDLKKAESLPQAYRAVIARGSENSPKHNITDKNGKIKVDFITINGKKRPTTNSEGKAIGNTVFSIHNFYRWFGDSKAVDEQGRPLVVYHGTSKDFEIFKNTNKRFRNKYDNYEVKDVRGFYFTPDIKSAEVYSQADEGTPNIKEVYLSLKKPKVYNNYEDIAFITSEKVSELKKAGYDGAVYKDRGEFGETDSSMTEYVVFEANQIKSTDNRGTFAPNEDNIYYQRKKKVQADKEQKVRDRKAAETGAVCETAKK